MHFIKLRIAGNKLPFDELIQTFGMNWIVKQKKFTNERIGTQLTGNEDVIAFEEEIDSLCSLEDEVVRFVEQLYCFKSYVKNLSSRYSIKLWLSIYPETDQMNLCFTSKIIEKVSDMGIDIDVSILCLQQFYQGDF